MRYIFLLMMLLLPWSSATVAAQSEDSLLKVERFQYYMKYRFLKDTITVNTWTNMKRLTDNLEKIVEIDNLLLDSIHHFEGYDPQLEANYVELHERYEKLLAKSEQQEIAADKEGKLLFYLEIILGVLAIIILSLIIAFIGNSSTKRKLKRQSEHYEVAFEEKRIENESLEAELLRLKTRELEFREELEKGMQANQERLLSYQEKCSRLEEEKENLERSARLKADWLPDEPGLGTQPVIPENEEEKAQIIRVLSDERDSLMKLATQLQGKLDLEKGRRKELLNKIDVLIQNLTQISDNP